MNMYRLSIMRSIHRFSNVKKNNGVYKTIIAMCESVFTLHNESQDNKHLSTQTEMDARLMKIHQLNNQTHLSTHQVK